MKPVFVCMASALALALAGCGGESDLNQAAASIDLNAPLAQVPAPNNGDWTQNVQQTPEGAPGGTTPARSRDSRRSG